MPNDPQQNEVVRALAEKARNMSLPEAERREALRMMAQTRGEWVSQTAVYEAESLALWTSWYFEHRDALERGIWSILKTCSDLGAAKWDKCGEVKFPPIILEELAVDAWTWLLDNMREFRDEQSDDAPIPARLYGLGAQFAETWRNKRLAERSREGIISPNFPDPNWPQPPARSMRSVTPFAAR